MLKLAKYSSIDATNTNNSWLNKGKFTFGSISKNTETPKDETSITNNTANVNETVSEDEDDENVVKNDTDPHFDPIVPLPEIVETRTGEEDEDILFCERAKIFRYDENKKEWKERGVGQLKVLYHPINQTFRLLLRRDQVHKIVLNQRIVDSINLQPLSSSRNSFCWFGMNFPEENTEPVLEKLAARFKTEEITEKFYETVMNSVLDVALKDARDSQTNNTSIEEKRQSDEDVVDYAENSFENYDDSRTHDNNEEY